MKLLAIDTATDACVVGLQTGERLDSERVTEPRAHSRVLLPMITRLLERRRLEIADLDALVLGVGPGSFIGVRIGASVAQGLACGGGLEIVPVSTQAALAAELFATADCEQVVVAQDARMGEVYLDRFGRDTAGLPVAAAGTVLWPVAEAVAVGRGAMLAGAGWQRHPTLLGGGDPPPATVLWPDARYLLAIGRRDFLAGRAQPPETVEPAYVRHTVAAAPGGAARQKRPTGS